MTLEGNQAKHFGGEIRFVCVKLFHSKFNHTQGSEWCHHKYEFDKRSSSCIIAKAKRLIKKDK